MPPPRPTTLFVATDDQLKMLFAGVRYALEEPITAIRQSPIMNAVMGGASWDPGEHDEEAAISKRNGAAGIPSIYAAGGAEPIEPVTVPDMETDHALEETAPVRLRSLPHAAVLGVTGVELEMLAFVLVGDKGPPPRIVDTETNDGFVDGLSTEALLPLAMLDNSALDDVVERWSAALKLTARKGDRSTLLILRELAREAIACGGHLFAHMPA